MDTPITHPYGTRSKTRAAMAKGKEMNDILMDDIARSPCKLKCSKSENGLRKKHLTACGPAPQALIPQPSKQNSLDHPTTEPIDASLNTSGTQPHTDSVGKQSMGNNHPIQLIISTNNRGDFDPCENGDHASQNDDAQSYTDSDSDDCMHRIERSTTMLSLRNTIPQQRVEDTSAHSSSEDDMEMWAIYWKALTNHVEYDPEEWEIYSNAVKAHDEQQDAANSHGEL